MKRILFIQPGPCYNITNTKQQILAGHFEGDILTFSNSDRIVPIQKSGEFNFHCLKVNQKNNPILVYFKFLIFCIHFCLKNQILYKKKFDLVTTYDPLKTGFLGVIASRLLLCKFIPEINGTYSSPYNYYDKSIKHSKRYAFLYTQIMKIVFTFSHGIKYQYDGQIKFFEKSLGKRSVSAFPNLVYLDRFTNIADEKEILVVGFPFWRKGIDIAIKAFKSIADNYPDWKLKILGWYPDITLLEKHINAHPQIYHHKPVPKLEMPQHIGKASIICCPSRSEGVPRVLMESMMAEKPRIGSNVDGIPVVIKDQYDGLLFENENSQQLAEKMSILIENPELRKIMGSRGKKRVLSEFSKEQYLTKLVKLYNSVLE